MDSLTAPLLLNIGVNFKHWVWLNQRLIKSHCLFTDRFANDLNNLFFSVTAQDKLVDDILSVLHDTPDLHLDRLLSFFYFIFYDILCGVPQGSVLGPSAFSIYLINITAALIGMNYILCADDLQAYLSCFLADLHEAFMLVETNIRSVHNWASANKLKLNLSKTKIMIVGSQRNVISMILTHYTV